MEKAHILIVEDEPLIGLEIKNILQDLGYRASSIVDTFDSSSQPLADCCGPGAMYRVDDINESIIRLITGS